MINIIKPLSNGEHKGTQKNVHFEKKTFKEQRAYLIFKDDNCLYRFALGLGLKN